MRAQVIVLAGLRGAEWFVAEGPFAAEAVPEGRRRGLALLRTDREVVARAVDAGCEPVTGDEGCARVRALVGTRRSA